MKIFNVNNLASYFSAPIKPLKKLGTDVINDPRTRWVTSAVALVALSYYSSHKPSPLEVLDKHFSFNFFIAILGSVLATVGSVNDKFYNVGTILNVFQMLFPSANSFAMSYEVFLTSAYLFSFRQSSSSQQLVSQRLQEALGGKNIPAQEEYIKPSCSIHEMMEHLNQYVVGQQHAKETLTQAIYFHYNSKEDSQLPKGNVLLIGPSGSGKTFLVETLSKKLDIPMAILDISKVTPEGYTGPKITDVFHSLLQSAGGNVAKANHGIIFIDEIDKQFKEDATNHHKNAFQAAGQNLLNQLLCALQGCDVLLPSLEGRGYVGVINTKNILFIFAGAFHELTNKLCAGSLTDEQLLENGVRAEFLGRIGYISQLNPLNREEIKKILTHGPQSVVGAWEKLYDDHGYELILRQSTIDKLVDEALGKPTGARGMHFTLRRLLSPILAQHILEKETNKNAQSTERKCIEI